MSRMNEPVNPQETPATEQMRQKASQVGQNIREMGGQVRQAAREQVEHLREQATEYYQQGRVRAREWGQDVEKYIQDQPIKSVAIAAGVGFLLGAIWKRR